jgi:hypothetical protein
MQNFAEKMLQELKISDYRMGFHLPPQISVWHVHLHCFALPISSFLHDKVIYGSLLKSIDTIRSLKP